MNPKKEDISKYYSSQEYQHDLSGKNTMENFDKLQQTVDEWRHARMYKLIMPLLNTRKGKKWLTVGDGRFGHEAHYISEHGGKALATDLSIKRLAYAKKQGYIGSYKKENAENLTFRNESFDFTLCKETYHHLPRPMVALYEMLRVSKEAVILIEPNDVYKRTPTWKNLFAIEDPERQIDRFEVTGNYVYSISRRELIKVALGIGIPAIAFNGIDDYYIPGVESEFIADKGPLKRKIDIMLSILDISYRLGIRDRSLLIAIIFRHKPSPKLRAKLATAGYKVVDLPKNPYLR